MSGHHHHGPSGHHHHDHDGHVEGPHHGHDHGHGGRTGPIFRPLPSALPRRRRPPIRSRRAFLGDLGKGTLAMAVITPLAVACGGSDDAADTTTTTGTGTEAIDDTTTSTTVGADGGAGTDEDAAAGSVRWARANLGFVSAYVLARGNTAAIVDTGNAGSADAIGESLASLGLNYDDVGHVILTHRHPDHVGSIGEVVERAAGAAIYAGQADLDEIAAESIVSLVGGEDVFGFEMLATPGHTEGHMAVIDHQAGLLVAGDAIFTEDGGVIEGPERFFDDVDVSRESIRALAALSFNTLLVGHGEPIEQAADTAVAALAASLP